MKEKELIATSPQKTLAAFMEAWLYQDYQKMYSLSNKAWASSHTADFIWDMYSAIIIDDYEITSPPGEIKSAMITAKVRINFNGNWLKPATINLVCETKTYTISLHGTWGVNPNSTLKLIERKPSRSERRKKERDKKK